MIISDDGEFETNEEYLLHNILKELILIRESLESKSVGEQK